MSELIAKINNNKIHFVSQAERCAYIPTRKERAIARIKLQPYFN